MANRWPAIAGACMWGIAVGLVAYRYAMLPLLWSSPWRHVVPGVAIGLAFGGRQLLRERDGGLGGLVLAGVLGAAAAFAVSYAAFPTVSRAELETWRLPGFSVDLPDGEAAQEMISEYATGKLLLKGIAGSRSISVVQWEPGGEMTDDDMQVIAKALATGMPGVTGQAHPTSVTGRDGKPVRSIKFDSDKIVFEMSLFVCGSRHVLVGTAGEDEAIELHPRIVASFTCTPDASLEKAASQLVFPMNLDLPGWYATSRDPDSFEITDGKTGTMSLRALSAGLNQGVKIENMVEPVFRAAGLTQGVDVGAVLPDGRVPFKLTIEGEITRGWAALVRCPKTVGVVLAFAVDDASAEAMHDKLAAAKCRGDGEPVQTWPDPPPGANDSAVP